MKALLGGKGANLAEMTNLGLPVPPGFTISTEVCTYYYQHGKKYPRALNKEVESALRKMEKTVGMKFGDPQNPLLVSVRSGARASMPGMMDTILNLGLNDETIQGLIQQSGNPRFAYDSYRRFVQMYGDVVLGLKPEHKDEEDPFELAFEEKKRWPASAPRSRSPALLPVRGPSGTTCRRRSAARSGRPSRSACPPSTGSSCATPSDSSATTATCRTSSSRSSAVGSGCCRHGSRSGPGSPRFASRTTSPRRSASASGARCCASSRSSSTSGCTPPSPPAPSERCSLGGSAPRRARPSARSCSAPRRRFRRQPQVAAHYWSASKLLPRTLAA